MELGVFQATVCYGETSWGHISEMLKEKCKISNAFDVYSGRINYGLCIHFCLNGDFNKKI